MASSAVAILSVVGILGTAGAAMAVNADVLDGASDSALGNASSVLVPSSAASQPGQAGPSDSPSVAPAGSSATRVVTVPSGSSVPPSSTSVQPISSGANSVEPEPTTDPVIVDEPAQEEVVDGTTGGSGGGQGNYDDENDDESNDGDVNDDSYAGGDND